MTAFSPASFQYDSEDKGFDYTSQILQEPFNDFFDQYLTHTISAEANEFEYPDPFTDGETVTDSTSNASSHQSQHNFPQDRSQKRLSKTAFLPQNYSSRPRRERLQPAVSGLELLLDIEGQADRGYQGPEPPYSAPAHTSTLPLRRKPRFRASQSINHASRSGHQTIGQSKNMIRPFYNYRHECPQPQEWTHGLEQLSLNPGSSHFSPSLPPADVPHMHDGTATAFRTPRHMTLRDEFLQGEASGDGLSSSLSNTNGTVQAQDESFDPFQEHDGDVPLQSTLAPHDLHQSPPWARSVSTSSDATYTLSGNHHHGLSDCNSDSYYTNGLASKSAPALPYQLNPQFSMESFGAIGDSAEPLTHDDIPIDALPPSQKPQHSYPDPPALPQDLRGVSSPSHSPPRRISSPSIPPTPSRATHRRSKSAAPRRKSASTLRTPKSNGSMSMGFVNFTPQDSKKILTGVAPSGSSKTKARREQEANEKKRKLSAAVLRALEEAGGDTEGLRREGLLVDG